MGTVAAVQSRGGAVAAETVDATKEAFAKVNAEFNAFDETSTVRRLGTCTAFGRACWDFAYGLKAATGGAFDPAWRKDGTLDFGAVAKGFAVDVACDGIRKTNPETDVLVDLGGNLKAAKGDWTVGIKGGDSFVLTEGSACATSATYFRGDHIKDARTGEAVSNRLFSVTVVHPESAMVADGLSTVLFILGQEKGDEFLKKHHPEAKAVWIDAGL